MFVFSLDIQRNYVLVETETGKEMLSDSLTPALVNRLNQDLMAKGADFLWIPVKRHYVGWADVAAELGIIS